MNLFRKIESARNKPPYPGAPFIEDRYGAKYWIQWNSIDILHISSRKDYVGKLALHFRDDGSVVIADLIIYPSFSGNTKRRHQGIGKAMLQEGIRYAKERGAQYIWGWTSPDEYTTHEYLADWFGRQGFEVTEEDGAYTILKLIR